MKRPSRRGPPPPRMANPHNGFYRLFWADDVAEMVKDAVLPLAPGATPVSVAAFVSEAFGNAIGTFLALQNGTGAAYSDVREWLGKVEAEAAALLERLGCNPAWAETVEREGSELFCGDWDLLGINELAPYLQHLSTRSFLDGPPFMVGSIVFRDWLRPAPGLAPHDAILRAIPECLAILMICARRCRADLAQPAGRSRNHFRSCLFASLAGTHYHAFGRKPITREDGERAGSGALWARSLCEKAAKLAAAVPSNRAPAVAEALTKLGEAPDATLLDYLDEGWKAWRETEAESWKSSLPGPDFGDVT